MGCGIGAAIDLPRDHCATRLFLDDPRVYNPRPGLKTGYSEITTYSPRNSSSGGCVTPAYHLEERLTVVRFDRHTNHDDGGDYSRGLRPEWCFLVFDEAEPIWNAEPGRP